VLLLLQGKIQGFGSGGPGEAARSSSGHYGGIGSSGTGNYGGGFRSSGSSGLAAAQQAASQLTHAAQQALGDGPIAQGLASAVNSLGGLLQPAGYGSRLNVSVTVPSAHLHDFSSTIPSYTKQNTLFLDQWPK
jgi:hypothetical protein